MHELVKTMVNRLCLKTRKWTFRPLITGGHVLPARQMLVGMTKCAFHYVFISCRTNAKQCKGEWTMTWPTKIISKFSSYQTSSYCRECICRASAFVRMNRGTDKETHWRWGIINLWRLYWDVIREDSVWAPIMFPYELMYVCVLPGHLQQIKLLLKFAEIMDKICIMIHYTKGFSYSMFVLLFH